MFKENLMSALKRAVDLHNSGSGDNDAIVKSASEHEFNPNQTQRLVETYNTAKTICFYKTAEDRAGKFSLADGGAVAKNLFKDCLPEKKADTMKINDYSCYDDAIIFDEVGTTTVLDEVKYAAAAVPQKMSEHVLASKLKEADNIKLGSIKAGEMADMLDMSYGLLLNEIAVGIGMDKAAEAYSALSAQPCIDMAAQVIDDIMSRFPGFDKEAAPDFTMFDTQHPDLMAKYAEACDYFVKYAVYRAAQAELMTAFEKMSADLYNPITPDSGSEFFTPMVRDMIVNGEVKYAQQGGKGGGMLLDPIGTMRGGVESGVQSSTKDFVTSAVDKTMEAKNKQSQTLTDRAKNLHRKFILEKMITTDPILKGLPEEDVIRAYQSIVHLAPEVSLNEEVTRSILRQATNAQSIDPFTAKGITDLDASIRSQLEQQGGKKPAKKPQGAV